MKYAAAVRLGIMAVQALVQLGISAQRIREIAEEAEANDGQISDNTVARVEADAKAVNEGWDSA